MQIPMSSPDITAAEIEAVNRVLQTPHLSIGPRIVGFEERTAAYVGVRHAVGVSSGTAGLHLCIIAADIGEGCYIGMGANVIQGITIGPWSIIGAGAVVIRDIPPHVTAVGVPARVIKVH